MSDDYERCVMGTCQFNCGKRCMAREMSRGGGRRSSGDSGDSGGTVRVLGTIAIVLVILYFGTQMFGDSFKLGGGRVDYGQAATSAPAAAAPTQTPQAQPEATPLPALPPVGPTESPPTPVPSPTFPPPSDPWVDVGPITLEQYNMCIASNCTVHWKCGGYCE